MSEPTSALTFSDLIVDVATKLGVAYYGADGDEAAQAPTDAHDLALCKAIVNKAIRMFIHDAPPSGWRWTKPVAQFVIWAGIATDDDNAFSAAAYNAGTGLTTLTVPTAAFYPSMELKTITITDVGDQTINSYVSSTQITISGDVSAADGKTWSMAADGNYTLPDTFSGQFNGQITYAAGTNEGPRLSWVDESVIRAARENSDSETGTPSSAAVRLMTTGSPRRRWELLTYPIPDEVLTTEFAYILHFDSLVNLTDVHPAPFAHDETVRAACMAMAEKEVEDKLDGPEMQYYRNIALANSHAVDARSAPRRLGYCGNGVPASPSLAQFREHYQQWPAVTFNE